jgi:hypothetical protein
MKYLLITLEVQEGERTYTLRHLMETECESIKFAAERLAARYAGKDGTREDNYWWFIEFALKVDNVIELTKYEYDLMSSLFSGYRPIERANDILDTQDFYEAMYSYRIASMSDQKYVIDRFENVKTWIRKNFRF